MTERADSNGSSSDGSNSLALMVGGEVKTVGMAVSGRLFVFTPTQMQFLLNLQKMKNVLAAALSVDKPEEWAQGFLKSRKFREYIACKMEEYSVKNGLTVEWWYQFGKWTADGAKESVRVKCGFCGYAGEMTCYEAETHRGDDMGLEIPCPACWKPAAHEVWREAFTPSREQVVAWQDLGARLIPKVERVHHMYTNEEIIFQSADGGGAGG